ncbi:hypothetical protein TruAng_009755 [Truncatella angustata]|nr:hypothetical protein TruAng_009755 [Truncatella angustata]
MLTTSYAIALCGLMSSALATYHPQALRGPHDIITEPGLVDRQTNAAGCIAFAVSLATSILSAIGELSGAIASIVATADLSNPTSICDATTAIPASLSSDYSSYESAVVLVQRRKL